MKIEDFNFAGHKAIVRVDFNVPLDENGNVTDDTRIRGALPTLKKVLADGGALIMMSHMGKPKGKVKPELSLSQIVKNVSDALGVDVKFAKDCGNADAEAAALKPGEALLLENLRFYPEEEGKPVGVEKGTPEFDAAKAEMKERQKKFAAKLASYADVYVMDAFGFRRSLLSLLGGARPERALVLGTGGASKAVGYVLGELGIPFDSVSRDSNKCRFTYGTLTADAVSDRRLIVNATPLGTYPATEGYPPIPYEGIGPGHFLFDLVYNPPLTEFLRRGAERGAATRNGYDMLVGQAERAWEIWNGKP